VVVGASVSLLRFLDVVSEVYPKSLSIEQDHPSRQLDDAALRQIIRHVLAAEGATLVHLSVVLTGHETVRRLNQSYLDHDYDTDVLSFSLREAPAPDPSEAEGGGVEGEVYVDLDTAAERHEEFNTSFEREAYRYVIHGLLHLLGYDDATDAGQDTMREKENQYLNAVVSKSDS
jgi:rRNA maturation RNase YbeY